MIPKHQPRPPALRGALFGAALLMAGATTAHLHAQATTAATPSRASAEEDTITLSPFIIQSEKETGWSANDTLSATRTKQALKDVPIAIDAITADFMEDLGMFTADDVANYVSGVYAAPLMENDNQQGGFAFRGLSQSNNLSRNYFRWFIPSDTYNVERIDFGKGSNSLIFGEVEPGGMGAVFTKRPQLRNFGTALLQYNDEGAYRAQLDVNRRLRNNLALRLNLVKRQEKTFQDASTYKFEGETLAVVWQPFKNTSIRIEGEHGLWDSVRGYAGVRIRELSARGRGFASSGIYYTSDGVWIQQSTLPSIDRGSGNASAGGDPSLIDGSYFDVTMRNAAGAIVGTKRVNGFPKHYNLRGSFDNQARPFDSLSVTLEQKAGPVNVELAYNHQKQHQDRNDNAFDGPVNVDVNGRLYMDAQLDRKRFGSDTHAFRGSAVYHWNKLKWMQQLFVVSAEYREHSSLNYRLQGYNVKKVLAGTASGIDINNDRARLRVYLDDPQFYSRDLYDRMQLGALPVTETVDVRMLGFFASGTDAADGTSWNRASAASAFASGKYFGGRVQSLIGIRRDESRLWEYTTLRYTPTYGEAIMPPKRSEAQPGEYTENKAMNQARNTSSAGLTVALTKDVNLYGVYSESFRFQDAVTFDNVRFGPITGVTKEIGVKGSFLDDRVNVTIGAFDIDRQNVVLSYNNVISLNADQLEDLMNPNDILPGDPRYKYSAPGTGSGARNYGSTENSRGVDATLMLRPTKGLQLRFTVSRTKVQGQPDLSSFRAYYDAAVARGNEAPGILSTAKLLLDTLDFNTRPTGARAAPWSASWIADYAFQRGAWKSLQGVRLGLNGSWRDDYLFGIPNGQEMIGGSSHLVHGYIMRDQKLWGQQVRIRFGVKNITDLENGATRKISFTTLSTGANVYRYSYVMPTMYDLSITVKF